MATISRRDVIGAAAGGLVVAAATGANDNGHFPEFGTFSISDRIARTPPQLLATNFGGPEATFAAFPKGDVFMPD